MNLGIVKATLNKTEVAKITLHNYNTVQDAYIASFRRQNCVIKVLSSSEESTLMRTTTWETLYAVLPIIKILN